MQGEYRGDFTRDTFNPTKHFSRVLMQQGRVLLDEDWNEQVSITLYYLRSLAEDLVGEHGGRGDGFKIEGVTQTDGKLDFKIKQGYYYVKGWLCKNAEVQDYRKQPGYPFPDSIDSGLDAAKPYLVYLDVWERHITSLEDDSIREVALGGPDTATRAQLTCQVKVKEISAARANTDFKTDHNAFFAEITEHAKPTSGSLRARAKRGPKDDEPCAISPESRFRGTENQLYRVEIHRGGENGATGQATFKWSRENGSIVFPIRSLGDGKVTLAHLGRDLSSSLQVNDWVEIVDDDLALRGKAGPLRQVESIDPVEMSVTLKNPGTLPPYNEDKHPLLRRWDQQGDRLEDGLKLKEGAGEDDENWIALEDGIQIQFPLSPVGEPCTYRSGDYWLIPARTATGDVEWPVERNADGTEKTYPNSSEPIPAAKEPHGIKHFYAPLAKIAGAAAGPADLRRMLIKLWS
jgi:hypothetical protein